MDLYRKARLAKSLYGLCGSLANETYHHWRVFTQGENGAFIVLDKMKIEKAFEKIEGVRLGAIEYVSINSMKNFDATKARDLPFIKRLGFKAEHEYRVIFESNDEQRLSWAFKPEMSCILRIVLNPWLPMSVAKSVINFLKRSELSDNILITQSSLVDTSGWKAAGERLLRLR